MQLWALEHIPFLVWDSSSVKQLPLPGLAVGGRSSLACCCCAGSVWETGTSTSCPWPSTAGANSCWEPAVRTGSTANCSCVTGLKTGSCGMCGLVFAACTGVGITIVGSAQGFSLLDLLSTCVSAFVCPWRAWTLLLPGCTLPTSDSLRMVFCPLRCVERVLLGAADAWHT